MAFIYDGYSTQIGLYDNSNNLLTVFMRIKTVTPPELDGGGPLDTADMTNRRMRTQAPKSLLTSGPMKCSVFWDPFIYSQFLQAPAAGYLQRNVKMILKFPDNSGLSFWGWVDKFTPPEHKEGEEPMADLTVLPSHRTNANANGRADGVESIPVYLAPAAMVGFLINNGMLPQP